MKVTNTISESSNSHFLECKTKRRQRIRQGWGDTLSPADGDTNDREQQMPGSWLKLVAHAELCSGCLTECVVKRRFS